MNKIFTAAIYVITFALAVSNIFFVLKARMIKSQYSKMYEQYQKEDSVRKELLGKSLSNARFYNCSNNQYENIDDNTFLIIFGSLDGCGKCFKHHMQLGIKYNNDPKVYFLLESSNDIYSQYIKNTYSIQNNLYLDKNKIINELAKTEVKRALPFVIAIHKRIIVNITFSHENDYLYIDQQYQKMNDLLNFSKAEL